MRDSKVYSTARALPRMSWSSHNLFIIWLRTFGYLAGDAHFTKTDKPLFGQRWIAKRLVRGYHGDFVGERKFKRWYLPASLPDVRARQRHGRNTNVKGTDIATLLQRPRDVAKNESDQIKEEEEGGKIPVGSLFLSELERRLDVVIFRSCLAQSVYHARHMVIRGMVKLNGIEHNNPNTRMNPGDMVSVNPSAIRFLSPNALKDTFLYGTVASMTMPKREATGTPPPSDSLERQGAIADATSDGAESHGKVSHSRSSPSEKPNLEEHVVGDREKHSSASKLVPTTPASIVHDNGSVFHLPPYAAPFLFVPAYLEVNFPTCSTVYVRHPTARPNYSEIPTPFAADGELIRLAWEWYSRIRPRMRRKRDLWMSPDRTRGQWGMGML